MLLTILKFVIASIECTVVIFHSHKPTRSANMLYQLAATMAVNKIDLKQSCTCITL